MKFTGKGVCGGIAFGKIRTFIVNNGPVSHYNVSETDVEAARFRLARESALKELKELYRMACDKIGEENACIFEMHGLMLEDDMFTSAITDEIYVEQINAEYAIEIVRDRYVAMFQSMEDELFRVRSIDVKDISERVINILLGRDNWLEPDRESRESAIIVADELMPSKTIQLGREYVRAFVTKNGSTNSHSAIIAKEMGITAMTAVNFESLEMQALDGRLAAVDGHDGVLYIDPDWETRQMLRNKRR